MDALRNVSRMLVPGGAVLDAQPLPPGSRVEAGGEILGRLDQDIAFGNFAAVEPFVQAAVADGILGVERELEFDVVSVLTRLHDLPQRVAAWEDTRVDGRLLERMRAVDPPLRFRDRVRLRVLRAQ